MKKNNDEYKVIISELGTDPFRILNSFFVLVGIIPLLVLFYLIIKEELILRIFLGSNGFVVVIAIFIACLGYLYAYLLIRNLLGKLLKYAQERKLADQEKSEVMLAVTHDLKNPLATIKISLENLIEGVGGQLSSVHANIAQICLANVGKLLKFIDELLSSSRDEFKRMSIEGEHFDLGSVIRSEVESFRQLAKKTGQDLSVKIAAGDASLWADKDKISRVVSNLVSNAIKYTPEKGKIDVALFSDKDTVTLTVVNTGPGIKPDEMEALFKKFKRLNKHSEIEGAGLGLTIVKDMVDLHNGHITVKSELGKETEFKVVLPKNLSGKTRGN